MREKAEMKKSETRWTEDSLNLQKMYEQRLTPQRKVEAFRRYVIKLKRQRNFGRALNDMDDGQADIRLFREEALYMKGLITECDARVRLSKEIRCLEEMTDEQIACYYMLVRCFQNDIVEPSDVFYARYYLLEVANLIYQDTPQEACKALFSFWDAWSKKGKLSNESREYFYTVCSLFMLTFQELMPQMTGRLEELSGRDWSGQALENMEKGVYASAGRFVMQNARMLKENEKISDKVHVFHAWKALPHVFLRLETELKTYDFRHMILNGFYKSVYIGEYPVMCGETKEQKDVRMSKYLCYEYQNFSDYWKVRYYVLYESVQDFLCVIYQETERQIRRHMRVSARKGSVSRILDKAYSAGAEPEQNTLRIKEVLRNDRFYEAVRSGVLDYLTAENVDLPKRKRCAGKKASEQDLDYEKTDFPTVIDREKLRRAKEDAEQVLAILSEGEIAYDSEDVSEKQQETVSKAAAEVTAASAFNDVEKTYLRYLRVGDCAAAEEYLHTLRMPEPVMMKNINHKALEMIGDLLLTRETGTICILEDYMGEADRILGEIP